MSTKNPVLEVVEEISDHFKAFEDRTEKQRAELLDRIEQLESIGDRPSKKHRGTESLRDHPALLRYIKTGDLSALPQEQKDMSIGGTDAGGATVPEFLVARIHERMRDLSPLISDVLAADPATSSDIKVPVNLRGTGTEWVSETGTRSSQSTPTIKGMVPTHGGCSSVQVLTQWLLQDSATMLDTYLVNEIAAEIALALEAAVISGSGTNRPTGLVANAPVSTGDNDSPLRDYQTLQYVASGAAATIPHDPTASPSSHGGDVLHNVVAALRIPYRRNARWLMNRTTLSVISKWKDADSKYLISPGLEGSRDMLLGYPIVLSDSMQDIGAGTFPVLFGDFAACYRLFQINAPIFVRDPYSTLGSVRLYYETRYAGAVADSDAVKALKVAAS